VNLRATKSSAILTVTDEGPGITSAELAKVFDPFYRGEAGNGTPGFGLGLAIAQPRDRHARRHDPRGERAAGGLQVTIELPLA